MSNSYLDNMIKTVLFEYLRVFFHWESMRQTLQIIKEEFIYQPPTARGSGSLFFVLVYLFVSLIFYRPHSSSHYEPHSSEVYMPLHIPACTPCSVHCCLIWIMAVLHRFPLALESRQWSCCWAAAFPGPARTLVPPPHC